MLQLPSMRKRVSSLVLTSWRNSVKCSHSPAEGRDHRRLKMLVCDWLFENKLDFHSEVVFRDNSRADIIISDWGVILEVLSSESLKDFKKKSYPFPAIPIRVGICEKDLFAILDDLSACSGSNADYYIKKFCEVK